MMRLLAFVPKNHLSAFVGWLAHIALPQPLAVWSIRLFARLYRIDAGSAERPLEQYRSIGDFFTRNLAPGQRPIESDLTAPVDGRARGFGLIAGPELEQIKGKTYSIGEFLGDNRFAPLGDAPLAPRYTGGTFCNFYLAPPDYHHIHSPVDGVITGVRAIPGKLWPVNDWSINSIDRLFAVNERIVVTIESSYGLVAVVMIGATNVGRISLTFDDLRSNLFPPHDQRRLYDVPKPIKAGERLGTFHLGSSVVVLFEPGAVAPAALRLTRGGSVRFGQALLAR